MTKSIAFVLLLLAVCTARAQERVPRDQCLKAACQVSLDLKQMLDTPIPTDPDIKRSVAVARDQHGALAIPEVRLSAESLAKIGKDPVVVGQLWMHKVVPLRDGQPVKDEELRIVNVGPEGAQRSVSLFAMALQKTADGKVELLLYGKDKKPVLRAAVKETTPTTKREDPIDISAVAQDNTGIVTLDILGLYEAAITVGPTE